MAELDKKKIINNKNEAINKINEYLDTWIIVLFKMTRMPKKPIFFHIG